MRKLLLVLLALAALVFAPPAAADPPTAEPFVFDFPALNPCTGFIHEVTITGTMFVHAHDGRIVVRSSRTITTEPDGFVGHGTLSGVDNGQVLKFTITDILTNPAGDRIRERLVFVVDLKTGTVRVEKGEGTCLGPA